MKHQMEPGLPFTDEMRKWFSGTYPQGEISESRGRHFVLEPDKKYVVRAGEHAVIMPRMAYGREADPASLSAGLFAALRILDDPAIGQVFARCPEGGGVAYAVQNRLKKAAAFHVIDAEAEV